jgi:hypothetical protein
MMILKIVETIGNKTLNQSADGKQFQSLKVLVSNPFFNGTTVHPSTKVLRISADAALEIKPGLYHVYVTRNGKFTNYWLQGAA